MSDLGSSGLPCWWVGWTWFRILSTVDVEARMAAGDVARVVVGVDGSLAGLQALRFTVTQARRFDVAVHAVRAWAVNPPGRDPLTRRLRGEVAAEALASVRLAFAEAMGDFPTDVTVLVAAPEGIAGPALVDYSCLPGDLLVVGDGRRGTRRLRGLGPTSRYCLRHARCPVLAVPAPEWANPVTVRRLTRDARRGLRRLV
jgi:nucleotide-binding universal stress UspA family protein